MVTLAQPSLCGIQLALLFPQMNSRAGHEVFPQMREHAMRLLQEVGVRVPVPEKPEQFQEKYLMILEEVVQALTAERERIGGDKLALPLFLLNWNTYMVVLTAPFGRDWTDLRNRINLYLQDLGLDPSLIRYLEFELGWIRLKADDTSNERSIDIYQALRSGASFNIRVIEHLVEDPTNDLKSLRHLMNITLQEIRDHRKEYSEDTARLAQLIEERDEVILGAIKELQNQLTTEGLSARQAREITEGDPKGLCERLIRWSSGANWTNAIEEALWAALEFVPAGTAVKLGIKVVKAFRTGLSRQA